MLTLAEAAEQLGLPASTLRHQVQVGRMRARLMGKTYVVTQGEVERYRATSLGKPGRPSHRSAPRPTR
jgi:excisionase family DNA binding protein